MVGWVQQGGYGDVVQGGPCGGWGVQGVCGRVCVCVLRVGWGGQEGGYGDVVQGGPCRGVRPGLQELEVQLSYTSH